MSKSDAAYAIFALFAFGVFLGELLGSFAETRDFRSAAVKHGKAEFYLDAQHDRQWRWLP